ncbi:MAG: hypothetical protein ACTHN0_06850 [Aquihabitans sp.]
MTTLAARLAAYEVNLQSIAAQLEEIVALLDAADTHPDPAAVTNVRAGIRSYRLIAEDLGKVRHGLQPTLWLLDTGTLEDRLTQVVDHIRSIPADPTDEAHTLYQAVAGDLTKIIANEDLAPFLITGELPG